MSEEELGPLDTETPGSGAVALITLMLVLSAVFRVGTTALILVLFRFMQSHKYILMTSWINWRGLIERHRITTEFRAWVS